MKATDAKSNAAIGFLAVLDDPDHGLFGGYLALNLAGRPLEFHCTAPIRSNRAQQILYGPTLEPYLYGEQIGRTLLEQAKIEPLAVCTDREPALAVREHVAVPVALVLAEWTPSGSAAKPPPESGSAHLSGQTAWRIDPAHTGGPPMTAFRLGRNCLAVPAPLDADRPRILDRLADLPESFDLAEPFGRIREAILEARRGGR